MIAARLLRNGSNAAALSEYIAGSAPAKDISSVYADIFIIL